MPREPLCPFCGAYSPRQCELDEETGGLCPWDEMADADDGQPDEQQEWHDYDPDC